MDKKKVKELSLEDAKSLLSFYIEGYHKAVHQFLDEMYAEGGQVMLTPSDKGGWHFGNAVMAFCFGMDASDCTAFSIANIKGAKNHRSLASVVGGIHNSIALHAGQNHKGEPFPAKPLNDRVAEWGSVRDVCSEGYSIKLSLKDTKQH